MNERGKKASVERPSNRKREVKFQLLPQLGLTRLPQLEAEASFSPAQEVILIRVLVKQLYLQFLSWYLVYNELWE